MTLYARIHAAAAQTQPRVVIRTVMVVPFYAIGWLAGTLARLVWGVLLWTWLAIKFGVTDGWSGRR
jgi:hypothetical protein